MNILGKIGVFIQKTCIQKIHKLIIGPTEFQITHALLHTSKYISLMSYF